MSQGRGQASSLPRERANAALGSSKPLLGGPAEEHRHLPRGIAWPAGQKMREQMCYRLIYKNRFLQSDTQGKAQQQGGILSPGFEQLLRIFVSDVGLVCGEEGFVFHVQL